MKFLKKVHATGEMSQQDLEEGGDFYEARLKLEELCDEAGVKCTVKPFDVYQGPYAFVDGKGIKVWFSGGEDPDEFFVEKGSDKFTGDFDAVAEQIKLLANKGLRLVKSSFLKRAVEAENKWRPEASDLWDYAMHVEPLYHMLTKINSYKEAEEAAESTITEYNEKFKSKELRLYKGKSEPVADYFYENKDNV